MARCRTCAWLALGVALGLGLFVPWLAKSSLDEGLAASARAALVDGGLGQVSAESDWGRVRLRGPAELEAGALAAAQRAGLRGEMHSVRYDTLAATAPAAPPEPAAASVAAPPDAASQVVAAAPTTPAAPVADAQDLQARLTTLLGATTVQFDTGSSRIRPESLPKLEAAAALIRQLPTARILIEGHTDSQRVAMGNLRLSERRAVAVRDHLVHLGVTPAQLQARGFGVSRPLMSNDTDDGRAANRRISFTVQGG